MTRRRLKTTNSAILDGELCLIDPRGGAHFYRLKHQRRTRWPEEGLLEFLAFDLLHQNGVDLRSLPLTKRKRDLNGLCRQSHTPFLKQVETFPDSEVLFDYCNKLGFEGVISKRRASGYSSGPSRHWIKAKRPDWKRDNAERWRNFNQSEQRERERALLRKREELARGLEQLRTPRLHAGTARAVRADGYPFPRNR